MRIKLAILEKDKIYLDRIASAFNTKYADKFEIYSFTDLKMVLDTLDSKRIDVFLASDLFDIDVAILPNRCGFAYFVDSADIDTVKDQRAICKFQKVDLIYKQILSIYSEKAGDISGLKIGDETAKIIAFCSPCGGVGTSSMAASAAKYFSSKNKKTLYLNFEKLGSSDVFFNGEGQFNMSDVIFALKSKNTNLSLKLESCVKQDVSGVYFYSQSKVALDIYELKAEDIIRLIYKVKLTGSYDYIILDLDFALDAESLNIIRQSHSVVWISDGSENANTKIFRAYESLQIIEENTDSSIINRISLFYNKFSNKTSKSIENLNLKSIGGAPRYEHAATLQVIDQLSKLEVFNKI